MIPLLDSGEPERTGGYFAMNDSEPQEVGESAEYYDSGAFRVGTVPEDKRTKYRFLTQEKALRLQFNEDHRSSWQSRNEDESKWGGAVRISNGDIYSFSGLPEHGDEALTMGLAYLQGYLNDDDIVQLSAISCNHLIVHLLPTLREMKSQFGED